MTTGGERSLLGRLTSVLFRRRSRPAAFLDRDGVLNVDHGYPHRREQLEWIAGAPEAVRLFNEAGYYVIVITNQSGVARGYFNEDAVHDFHNHMQQQLERHGAHADAFYYCPHHPEGTVKEFAVSCRCRKPGPGLLEQAAHDWPIDRSRSLFIGDKDDDMTAAATFGVRGVKFDARRNDLLSLVRAELSRVR